MSGIILFLNAGDPGFDVLARVVRALDAAGVDWLELAVPFPDSVTDGPTIRRSARRALDAGADLDATLAVCSDVGRRRLKVALLADWHYTVRSLELDGFLARVRGACDGLLLHGVPPRARQHYYERAHALGVPLVTTAYAGSSSETLEHAARNATAYLYLAAGPRTGDGDPARMAPVIASLRPHASVPVAVGFGVKTAADVRAVHAAGADAAIVGSSFVAALENAPDPVAAARAFVAGLG